MLLPVKPICDPKKARRDGTSLIYIQYCYSSANRTQLNTEIAIPAKYWVANKQVISKELPSEYGRANDLNNNLTTMLRSVEDLIDLARKQGIQNKGKFLKQVFKPAIDVVSQERNKPQLEKLAKPPVIQMGVYEHIDAYIASKAKKVSKATLTVFKNVKDHLQAFEKHREKPIVFSSFDYSFYEDFIDFLTFDYIQPRRKDPVVGLKINTIGKTIKQFRIFIKDRVRRKLIEPIDLTDYKIPEEESDAIYLTYDEISILYNTDLTLYPHLKEYRDLFVLASLTGLRFSDFSSLRPEDLRNNRLHKKQQKSDHWVVIPLRPAAKEIFTKQFKDRIPQLTNAEFNRHIKTVGKLAGLSSLITFTSKKGNQDVITTKEKYEWITTHTARRSFATNEFLAQTPVKLIMHVTGHRKEKDFYRYIRISPEEAAIKIEQLWLDREKGMPFPLAKSA